MNGKEGKASALTGKTIGQPGRVIQRCAQDKATPPVWTVATLSAFNSWMKNHTPIRSAAGIRVTRTKNEDDEESPNPIVRIGDKKSATCAKVWERWIREGYSVPGAATPPTGR
jgi:hypothetical protein